MNKNKRLAFIMSVFSLIMVLPSHSILQAKSKELYDAKETNNDSDSGDYIINEDEVGITEVLDPPLNYASLHTINSTLYMKSDNVDYSFNDFSPTNDDSELNVQSIGNLKIDADFESAPANDGNFYITSNSMALYYQRVLPEEIVDGDGDEFRIYNDSKTNKILNYNVGPIHGGGFLVLKSFDKGHTWSYDNVSLVNMSNKYIKYVPSGEEITRGVTLRIISALKLSGDKVVGQRKRWIFWPFSYVMEDIIEEFFYTYMQEAIIHVESDIISARFFSSDVDYSFEDNESAVSAILSRATSLTDGSIAFNPITYSNGGNPNLRARYIHNDGPIIDLKEGDVLSKKGKYRITVSTSSGKYNQYTLFIIDKNTFMHDYFGDSLIEQSKRIFDPYSTIPVYMKGVNMRMNLNSDMPHISGTIYEYINGEFKDTPYHTFNPPNGVYSFTFKDTGIFAVDLNIGVFGTGGQNINLKYFFKIVNGSNYKPSVNYTLLTSTDRYFNIQRKAYAVNFKTTKGGAYIFLFPATLKGYNAASDFAYNIEKRFIETYGNGQLKYYYYHGVRYDSKVELYEKIMQTIASDVYITYINPLETYGVEILSEEKLQNIENQILERDVRVFSSIEVKLSLQAKDIIINNFIFAQITNYETERVVAIDEKGNEIEIPFDVNVNTIFEETGRYTIREYNWANVHEYDVYYIKENDNSGIIKMNIIAEDDSVEHISVKQNEAQTKFVGKRIIFEKSFDKYDSQTIVVVSKIGYRYICLLSEINTYLYDIIERGTYKIEVINRLGYGFSFELEVSGNFTFEEIEDSNNDL